MAYDATLTDPGAIQTAMKANSDAYASADPATQHLLHTDNLNYASKTGQTYKPSAGSYSQPTKSTNVSYPAVTPTPNQVPFIQPDGSTGSRAPNPTPASTALGVQPTAPPALGTQSDGTLHMNVNGEAKSDEKVFQGTSFSSARDLAAQLGLSYSADPKTGEISIGGTKVSPTSYDKNGDAIVGVRSVADALGYKIGYDDKSKTITVTGKPKDTIDPNSVVQVSNNVGNGSPIQSIANGMPQQQPMTPWTPPNLSGFQNNMMPYQTFNPNNTNFYNQAHNELDPQFNANNQKLEDKQNLDIKQSDESMNRRGIFSSGVAQAAENDLRAKTTNALAAGFTAQMAQIEKTAQTLFNTAYKQYQDGNQFALKNNQAQMTNMLNIEKQSFSEWAQTQKLDQAQYGYALKAWDQLAGMIMKDSTNQMNDSHFNQTMDFNQYKFDNPSAAQQLPYQQQTANNIADNQNKANIALLPYQSMTQYQSATTQEKQTMDAATNYFKQQGINIDSAKLLEAITHNRNTELLTASGQQITKDHNTATEANAAANTQLNAYKLAGYLPNGHATFDREKFEQTKTHDKDLVEIARTNAVNAENKTQIDAIGKELTSISGQINSIYSSYTTDPKQQAANTAMVTSLSGQRDKYITQLKSYTDQGFISPPSQ